eukprot:s976_g3.t1
MAGTGGDGRGGSPGLEDEENNPFGAPPTPAEVREHLDRAPKPNKVMNYDLREAEFWAHRHLPAGSVLEYTDPVSVAGSEHQVAVMVLSHVSDESGLWVTVKVLGSDNENSKKAAQKYFKSNRRYVHLCNVDRGGECPVTTEAGLHLVKFTWYPPGDFDAEWLSNQSKKAISGGKAMALEEAKGLERSRGEAETPGEDHPRRGSSIEEKLKALARPSALKNRRVSFADPPGRPATAGVLGRDSARVGAGPPGKEHDSGSLVPYKKAAARVKQEVIDLEEASSEKKKKSRHPSLGESLAQAAKRQAEPMQSKKKKRRRSRSGSRSRRSSRRHKRRRSSSEEGSRSSRTSDDSSEESLMPPLQRKAQKTPGAVFKMLESHMAERLSQDTALEMDEENSLLSQGGRPKFHTFFQLCLKPQLDSRSRDCKELNLLARCLDLLRAGRLERLADTLAARLMAVETATRQGWQTARFLEIDNEADEGSAPPHVLLAAQRHGRLVDKAGGKGSWPRTWSNYE